MKEIPGDHPDEANLMQPVIALSASESPLEPDGLESPDLLESTEVRADPSQEIMAAAPTPLHRILEAMLFVGGAPLTAERAITAIRGLTAEHFTDLIDMLNCDYRRQGRPYAIAPRANGFALALRTRFKSVLENLYTQSREARLSPTALDVLALVAYRQPVSKQEIESVRGAESSALLRQLVRRNLVAIVQRGEAGRREILFGTTSRFLELFQLRTLDDLPQTQDLQKL